MSLNISKATVMRHTKALIQIVLLTLFLPLSNGWSTEEDSYRQQRNAMIREILSDVQFTSAEIGKTALDPRVMQAMESVPRHRFVPQRLNDYAYENRPLPIGYGQTISQPYIVALMSDLLHTDQDDIALEIGTGSGYQAAILARLVKHVYTIEIIEPLGESARQRLKTLDFDNVTTRIADGYYGWEDHAPYDVIIVTAASGSIPPPLIQQLKPGGRMVIPVGGAFMTQQLMLVEKDHAGKVKTRQILPVRFVPLTRGGRVD